MFEMAIFLLMLFIKHLIIDFYFQTETMVQYKGKYGDLRGVNHSFQHFLGTWVVMSFLVILFPEVLASDSNAYQLFIITIISLLDGLIHYHIDWLKMKMERDIKKKEFWRALGCDQFLHQATYLFLAILIFI